MKPIETNWNGYRFRSRTEARWAVFFSLVGLRFEYEKEGYKLPSGWYLPDFWLPKNEQFFEVKGRSATPHEVDLCQDLADATGELVLLAVGAPDMEGEILVVGPGRSVSECSQWDLYGAMSPTADREAEYRRAYDAARGERFDGRQATAPTGTRTKNFRAHGW